MNATYRRYKLLLNCSCWGKYWNHNLSRTRNQKQCLQCMEALPYWQDLIPITHYQKRTHFPIYTCCSENHNNTCAENPRFEIWNSGGEEKNLPMNKNNTGRYVLRAILLVKKHLLMKVSIVMCQQAPRDIFTLKF